MKNPFRPPWEVYNDAEWTKAPNVPEGDKHVSYHYTRFGAKMKADDLTRMARIIGYNLNHHVYEVRLRND